MSVMNKLMVFLIVILLALGVSLLIPNVREAIIQLAVYGRLSIGDAGPTVEKIYIKNLGDVWAECPGASCYQEINGPGLNGKTVEMKVQIFDPNGDCDSQYDVRFYVCKNESVTTGVCNENYDDPDVGGAITASFNNKDGNRCNYTANYNYLDFWKKYGDWFINVSAKDNQNVTWHSITRTWFNNMISTCTYPWPGGNIIELGSVSLDIWTDDIGLNNTRNTGNVRQTLSWQSTNFTRVGGGDSIVIDNGGSTWNQKFCIDNDASHTEVAGCGFFNAVPMNNVPWYPTGGLKRCGDDTCSIDEDGASNQAHVALRYHILARSPKASGEYNNTIIITNNYCDPEATCGGQF